MIEVREKYKQIWNLIKNKLGIRFHSLPVHDKRYLKSKVKEYDGLKKTNFLGKGIPKENKHYTCIACITIDSVMRMDKKKYPQVYLEECNYKINKIQMLKFINTVLDSESDDDSDNDSDKWFRVKNPLLYFNLLTSFLFLIFIFFFHSWEEILFL